MTHWITLNQHDLKISERLSGTMPGVEIMIGLSPDDIPEKVRGYVEHETGDFIIEFKYWMHTREMKHPLPSHGAVTPVLGRESGRLYQIRVKGPVHQFQRELPSAFDALSRDATLRSRWRHYRVAEEAVNDNAQRLLPH